MTNKGEKMEKSDQINELVAALSSAQGMITPAIKDTNNPFFKSKYADLASVWEVIKKPLSDNKLAVIQHPTTDGNVVTVETVLSHASGQWTSSKLTMVSKDTTPQGIGSCITYARRYALSSILGVASELDDDGNAASGKQPEQEKSFTREDVRKPKTEVKHDPNEDYINPEQGTSLLQLIGLKGWTRQDLKEFIMFEWNLESVTKIQNKHLVRIRDYFSIQKPINPSSKDPLDVLPEKVG